MIRSSLAIILIFILLSVIGPFFVDESGIAPNLENHLVPPSYNNLFGYGVNGINVLTWLIYGARLSLLISMLVTILSLIIGTIFGALAGIYGGVTEAILMRIVDIFMAFPGLLIAFYVAAIMPPSTLNLVIALSASNWASYARLIRARVYELNNREFITAARALGAHKPRILTHHILPNLLGPVLVHASHGLSIVILAEAGMNFLGLGLPLGTPSWGALLAQGIANLFIAPYLVIFPVIVISFSVLGFHFLGEELRTILDPKNIAISNS